MVKLELQAQVETHVHCVCSGSLACSSVDLKTIQQMVAMQRVQIHPVVAVRWSALCRLLLQIHLTKEVAEPPKEISTEEV